MLLYYPNIVSLISVIQLLSLNSWMTLPVKTAIETLTCNVHMGAQPLKKPFTLLLSSKPCMCSGWVGVHIKKFSIFLSFIFSHTIFDCAAPQ